MWQRRGCRGQQANGPCGPVRTCSGPGAPWIWPLSGDAGFLSLSAEDDGSLDGAEASIGRFRLGLELKGPGVALLERGDLSSDRNRDIELWLDLIRSEGGQEDRDHSIELGTSLRF